MNVLLCVTGGIAAYKSADIITGLIATGHNVRVIMTESACKFITPLTLSSLSNNRVMLSMWDERGSIDHIECSKWADCMVIAPATANTIAKLAAGFADNLLTSVALAMPQEKARLIFPAMNTFMYNNPITKNNMSLLTAYGWKIFKTATKRLACGDVGEGALLKPREIVSIINKNLEQCKYCEKIGDNDEARTCQ
jgi:phosphopantothenoylcysteine decarboxylase